MMLAGSNAGVVVHRLLSLSSESDTRRTHCTHTHRSQKPKQLGIRIQKPRRVRPPSSRDQQKEGEEEKKKTEKRGKAAGFYKRMEGRRPRTFLPRHWNAKREIRNERNRKKRKEKKKKVIIKSPKEVCVCVLFISLVASVVRAINIQFLFVDIFYDVHFWAFFSFFLSPNRNIYETMDHVNNAARRSREREKVEGWKLGIQLSHKMDGHCGKKEADRPRRRRRRRLDERITSNRFVYLCIFFFVLHFFPVDNRRNQKTRRQAKDKKRKKEKTI